MKTILEHWLGLSAVFSPFYSHTQVAKITSDYWMATDELGRKTPDSNDAGSAKKRSLRWDILLDLAYRWQCKLFSGDEYY